jgi:hypothetical protein
VEQGTNPEKRLMMDFAMIAACWHREIAYEGCIARFERGAFLHRTAYFRFGELKIYCDETAC